MEPGTLYTYFPELSLGQQKLYESAITAMLLRFFVQRSPSNVRYWESHMLQPYRNLPPMMFCAHTLN